jgi:hypothetical protein
LKVGISADFETTGVDASLIIPSNITEPIYLIFDAAGFDIGEDVRDCNAASIMMLGAATKFFYFVPENLQDSDVVHLAGITKMAMAACPNSSHKPTLYMIASPCKGHAGRAFDEREGKPAKEVQSFFTRRLDPTNHGGTCEERNARILLDSTHSASYFSRMIGLRVLRIEEAMGRDTSDDDDEGLSVSAQKVLMREGVWEQMEPSVLSMLEHPSDISVSAVTSSQVVGSLSRGLNFINSAHGSKLCDILPCNVSDLISTQIISKAQLLRENLRKDICEEFRTATVKGNGVINGGNVSIIQQSILTK